MDNSLIKRQAAIDALAKMMPRSYTPDGSHPADDSIFMAQEIYADCIQTLKELPSAQPEQQRTFIELVVKYPEPELCIYKEYKGKPYYSIKYIENGETHVGYGTYDPKVLSQYISEYFISSAQPEIIRCKDCKHYADDQCDRYADETLGYVHSTQADGYCWVAER